MEKAKVFIAVSDRALTLAETLRAELSTDYSSSVIWSEGCRNQISLTIIETLEQASRDYDYAAIILTRDDLISRAAGDKVEQQAKTVANCIFEAGLFMAALGRERCFLVTDLESRDLPVDFCGLIQSSVGVVSDLRDLYACRMAIRETASEILNVVQRRGKLMRRDRVPLLSVSELFQREKPKADGGDLQEGLVVVADIEPLESYQSAIQVRRNLDVGVRYIYFCQADEAGAKMICSFLQMILLAGLKDLDVTKAAEAFQYRLEMTKQNEAKVLKTLQDICDRDSLTFYFMREEIAFPLRMHNTTSLANGKVYLKYGERGFAEWQGRRRTVDVWRDWQKYLPEQASEAVFRSTLLYSFQNDEGKSFIRSLKRQIRIYFPEIQAQVTELCFGKETGEQ